MEQRLSQQDKTCLGQSRLMEEVRPADFLAFNKK
jgi:hypothetical protein